MNRPVFIIIGAVAVVILLAIWVYVLFFSSSESSPENFADFNLGDTTDSYIPPTDDTEEEPVVEVDSREWLQQLTLEPVIGYQEVQTSPSSTPEVYYVETGTGNVISIDLEEGDEKKVSITTIPGSVRAAITPNGKYIMLESGSGSAKEFTVGVFSTSSDTLTTGVLEGDITSFVATPENTFLYSELGQRSLIGKEYDPETDKSSTLFTIPFREAMVVWGSTADAIHYAYPKASSELEGFLYEIDQGTLSRLPVDGYGLSANGNEFGALYSAWDDRQYKTNLYEQASGNTYGDIGIVVIPEKCSSLSEESGIFICASPTNTGVGVTLPDEWYQGEFRSIDNLWEVDLETLSVSSLLSLEEVSGRELDAVSLISNQTDGRIYFINKNDQTLWVYNRYLLTENSN